MSRKVKNSKDCSEEDKKFPLPVYKKGDDIYSPEKEEHCKEDDESETDLGIRALIMTRIRISLAGDY